MKIANTRIEGIEGLHVIETPADLSRLDIEPWTVYISGDKALLVSFLKHLCLVKKRTKNAITVCVLNASLKALAKVWCASVFFLEYLDESPQPIVAVQPQEAERALGPPVPTLEAPVQDVSGPHFIAYCINLDRRTDRWGPFETNFQTFGMAYERVSAVEDTNGALGCAKSHVKILTEHKTDPYIFIAEDDATIQSPIRTTMEAFLKTSADVLLLGYNTNSFKPFNEQFFRVLDAYTTSCYLVKQKAVPMLIQSFEKSIRDLQRGVKNPIDLEWHKLQKRLVFVVPKTHLVIQRESFSDIEKRVVNYRV
jgi:hypothetical protein